MPSRLDQDVFAAGGSAATDWAQAGGSAQVAIAAGASVDRGIDLDLGIQALANVDAGVGKFLSAEVSGQASASASVTVQIQAPMNLFREIGFAVRLQAIAELAAAVQVSLGLKLGDFLALAERDPQMRGLPIELLRVFLSEITIKGGVYAKAALTAQAYAQLIVTGTAIAQPARSLKPGFNIVVGAGVGLKAGAGFRVFAAIEFDDVSRFIARSVDVLVDQACSEARAALAGEREPLRALIDAARPAFKIAFRTAYELGEYIATTSPAANASGAQDVALRCTQVMLEEGQRFLLRSFGDAALEALRVALRGWTALTPRTRWDAALPARRALADQLRRMPPEPLQPTAANDTYWSDLIARIIDVAGAVLGPALDGSTRHLLSVLWSAVQLALLASRRVSRADASLSVIGQPPRQARAAFSGRLTTQPPPLIRDHIRASLARPPSGALELEHLVEFLVARAALDLLRWNNPGADRFLQAMTGPLGALADDVARTILRNLGSVIAGDDGQLDAQASLAAISRALRKLVAEQVHSELAPVLREHLASRPDLRMYFDEVFLPTIDFTLGTVFDIVLDWTRRGADRDRLTEALSGVVMKLVGRSLVVTADIMMAAAQDQIHDILVDLAGQVDAPSGIVHELSRRANLPIPVTELAELTADALRIGAEVLGPLTEVQRAKLRGLMYVVIDPLPMAADPSFLRELGDRGFIPNRDSMIELAKELGGIAGERLLWFVQKLLELLGSKVLAELSELLVAAQHRLEQWVGDAQHALEDMQRALGLLLAEVERLGRELAERFDNAAHGLLGAFAPLATRSGRQRFRTELATEIIDEALAVLADNDVYRTLAPPDLRRAMRTMARDAVEDALDGDLIDRVLDILGDLAGVIDEILDDVRELDPDRDLAEQVGNLLLNRISDAIYDHIGRDPHIRVGFDVAILGIHHRVSLGRIDVPVEAIVDGIRRAIRGLDVFEDAIRAAARAIASGFATEQQLQAADAHRTDIAAQRERLDRQRTALVTAPRGVRILSPAPGSVATGPAQVRIEVQGLLPDAAIDDDSPTSVHVFLNGRELALSSFTLTELGDRASAPRAAVPATPPAPSRYDPRAELALKPHPITAIRSGTRNLVPRGGLHRLAGVAVQGPAHAAERFPFTSAGAEALAARRHASTARPATATPSTATPSTATATPSTAATATATAATTTAAARPARPVTPAVARRSERRFGAPLTVTQIAQITAPSSGVMLSRRLIGADLEEGLNTLVVSIAPPGGARIETSCAFFVEAPPATPPQPGPGEIRLPVSPPRGSAASPPHKSPGKALLPPRAERTKTIEAAHKAKADRDAGKRATLLAEMFPTAKLTLTPIDPTPQPPGRPR